jgi:hypothetical protein
MEMRSRAPLCCEKNDQSNVFDQIFRDGWEAGSW